MGDVKRLARWTGWCDPCETERPLVLTESGRRGIRAWLGGIGFEDRALTLTCFVCGEWQDVPHDEVDLPDAVEPLRPAIVALQPLGTRQVLVRAASVRAASVALRIVESVTVTHVDATDTTLELAAEGFDLIALVS